MTTRFEGEVWFWRGPAPFYFVTLPSAESQGLSEIVSAVTYGWGMILVRARIGRTTWETALWPKDGRYILPVKAAVRKAEGIEEGNRVQAELEVIDANRRG